jgi:hypothetical protein
MEKAFLDQSVNEMLEKGAIYENKAKDLVLSSIYTVPKKDSNKRRPVINLRWVNKHIKHSHFKMATMKDVKAAITKDCFMAKIDLSDCFWGLPVHKKDQRFLSFRWGGKNYSFRCLPFGLNVSPYFITKLYHHVVAELQAKGHQVVIYIDDMLILGKDKKTCEASVSAVRDLLQDLGAIVNEQKSCFSPAQQVKYLGFLLDSKAMEISIPAHKVKNTVKAAKKLLRQDKATARDVASLLGKITSLADALFSARVHTTGLHSFKLELLRDFDNWDKKTILSPAARADATWWAENLFQLNGRSLLPPKADFKAATDASDFSWGAWVETDKGKLSWNGHFSKELAGKHINYKELLAVKYLLESVPDLLRNKTIDLGIDNTTALWYIRRMGGRRKDLALLAEELFSLCHQNNTKFLAYHLPGSQNILADLESRRSTQLCDLKLHPDFFRQLDRRWGPHTVDLFSTFENRQLPRFCSWQPQPHSLWVDAMSRSWSDENGWANPPFSLIGRILQKVEHEQSTITLIAPLWPAQPWYPKLLSLLTEPPVLLPQATRLFLTPEASRKRFSPTWSTLAWRISGAHSKNTVTTPLRSRQWSPAGKLPRLTATKATGKDGGLSQVATAKIQQLETKLASGTGSQR